MKYGHGEKRVLFHGHFMSASLNSQQKGDKGPESVGLTDYGHMDSLLGTLELDKQGRNLLEVKKAGRNILSFF